MISTQHNIEPQKVTKPIQLLAAWLVGLILITGTFLAAAVKIKEPTWLQATLVIAGIVNVPLFLAVFCLLQTKFRPELQEDIYYSQYLDKKTNKIVKIDRIDVIEKEISTIQSEMRKYELNFTPELVQDKPKSSTILLGNKWTIALNQTLPDFNQLRELLKENGIPLSDIFGQRLNVPERRNVAITKYIDFDGMLKAIELAQKMRMDSYSYFDPQEEYCEQHILYGSYGEGDFPINDELIKLIQSNPEAVDLRIFENKHREKL